MSRDTRANAFIVTLQRGPLSLAEAYYVIGMDPEHARHRALQMAKADADPVIEIAPG